MKIFGLKLVLMCLLYVLAFSLTGCDSQESESSVRYEESVVEINESIIARTEFPEYDTDVKIIRIELTNLSNNDDVWTDDANGFIVLKQEGDKWRYIDSNNVTVFATATQIPANGTITKLCDLETHYKLPLSPGNYRIRINVGGLVYAEFTVK
ncbi:MAG: hypothetical protein K2N06_00620 [Oscillospiraceae bacterium]|nr:hypothetical protein [Oscillospiraceae bacterium]